MPPQYNYQNLKKPDWAPPAWLFGPVWSILYVLIFISFGYVFWQAGQGRVTFLVVLPFVLNLLFNFAFTPIQFRLNNNLLAMIDILLTVSTLVWAAVVIFPIFAWVAYMQIPYLVWGTFATVLQISVTYLNRKQENQ